VLLMLLPLLTTLLTAVYLTRFWWLVFMGAPRDTTVTETAADVSGLLRWPLVGLAMLSVCLVWFPQSLRLLQTSEPPAVHDTTAGPWATSGEQVAAGYFSQTSWLRSVYEQYQLSPHGLTMVLALVLSLLGIALPWWRYSRKPAMPWGRPAGGVRYVFFDGLHWDALLRLCFVRPARGLGHFFQRLDRWWWDGLLHLLARIARLLASAERQFDERLIDGLVQRSARLTQSTGAALRSAQSGSLWVYVLLAVTGLVAGAGVIVGMMWVR
jgi:NADH:ubiquinone oxidoreductase subunit 5 (subunit L)/multisubunit Na+/H+ antiporter MnhA subunit